MRAVFNSSRLTSVSRSGLSCSRPCRASSWKPMAVVMHPITAPIFWRSWVRPPTLVSSWLTAHSVWGGQSQPLTPLEGYGSLFNDNYNNMHLQYNCLILMWLAHVFIFIFLWVWYSYHCKTSILVFKISNNHLLLWKSNFTYTNSKIYCFEFIMY